MIRVKLLCAGILLFSQSVAHAADCAALQAQRGAALSLVATQRTALSECLIGFADWKAEAHARFYDTYDVTETIPGKPRRVIITYGLRSATAYVALATRTHVSRTVEHEDVGYAARMLQYTPEQRAALRTLEQGMNVALSDEFLLCKDKLDAAPFIQALSNLGYGFQGGPEGIKKGYDERPWTPTPGYTLYPGAELTAQEVRMPLSQLAVNHCRQRAVEEEARQREAATPTFPGSAAIPRSRLKIRFGRIGF